MELRCTRRIAPGTCITVDTASLSPAVSPPEAASASAGGSSGASRAAPLPLGQLEVIMADRHAGPPAAASSRLETARRGAP